MGDTMRYSGLIRNDLAAAPGVSVTFFTQGCPHRCKGCHNPSTHDFNGGTEYDTEEILYMIKSNPLVSGITLSGGEPFAQSEACAEIAKKAKEHNLSVWCYTGYEFHEVIGNPLLRFVDVLVDGKFDESQKSLDLRYRGSLNQKVINVQKSLEKNEIVMF